MLSEELVKFIYDNKDVIERNDYELLYSKIMSVKAGELSSFLVDDCGINVLNYTKGGIYPLMFYGYKKTSFTIPAGIEYISTCAFYGSKIQSIEIPENVTLIGADAFAECIDLYHVTFKDNSSLETIKDEAFRNCSSLQGIKFPKNTHVDVGHYAFLGCYNLKSVDLSNVDRVGQYAFSHCDKLESVIVGQRTILGEKTFASCENIKEVTFLDPNIYFDKDSLDSWGLSKDILFKINSNTPAEAYCKHNNIKYEII